MQVLAVGGLVSGVGGNILGLARVSTEDQSYQAALYHQVQRLREYGCTRIYADIGSRADDAREGILKAIADIESGRVKELVITRLDRLTSSPVLYENLVKLLRVRQIPLTGTDEEISIHSEDGEFSAGIRIYIAKREVQVIRRRAQKGHESRRRNETANGVLPWGYVRGGNKRCKRDYTPYLCLLSDRPDDGSEFSGRTVDDLSLDVIEIFFKTGSLSQTVKAINQKYGIQKRSRDRRDEDNRDKAKQKAGSKSFVIEADDDLSELQVARRTRRGIFQWTHKGLRNWLYNPVLRGHTPYNTREMTGLDGAGRRQYGRQKPQELWDIVRDTHPNEAILSEDQYQQIRAIVEFNGRTKGAAWMNGCDRRHPVSGLLRCQVCGGSMKSQATKIKDGARRNYYRCKNSLAGACEERVSIRNDRAEAAIIQALTEAAERIDALRTEPELIVEPPELILAREQLAGLKGLGDNPAFDLARQELEKQIARIERAIIQKQLNKQVKQQDAVEILKTPDFWQDSNAEEKMKAFRWLVNQSWVKNGQIVKVELQF